MHQSDHLVGFHTTGINYLLISFSHDLHCLNLLREAVSVRRTILLESSSSKLSSSRLKTFLATSTLTFTNFYLLLQSLSDFDTTLIFLTYTNPTILLDAMLQALILCLFFLHVLRCLYLLCQGICLT